MKRPTMLSTLERQAVAKARKGRYQVDPKTRAARAALAAEHEAARQR